MFSVLMKSRLVYPGMGSTSGKNALNVSSSQMLE